MSNASPKKKPTTKSRTPNMWGMLSEVLVASMNKGQFPLAGLLLLFIVIVCRMPSADVSKLAFQILEYVANGAILGYLLSGLFGFGWFFHARWQRRVIANEMERVGREKSLLQTKVLSIEIESSQK